MYWYMYDHNLQRGIVYKWRLRIALVVCEKQSLSKIVVASLPLNQNCIAGKQLRMNHFVRKSDVVYVVFMIVVDGHRFDHVCIVLFYSALL